MNCRVAASAPCLGAYKNSRLAIPRAGRHDFVGNRGESARARARLRGCGLLSPCVPFRYTFVIRPPHTRSEMPHPASHTRLRNAAWRLAHRVAVSIM
jgi:hypothetical protein